jgi:predicted ATPase
MLAFELQSHRLAALHDGPIFFDRGVPDIIGYLALVGAPVPAHLRRAADLVRYNTRVFVAPPWREIFTQDEERRQTFADAEHTHAAMVAAYSACGYEMTELPRASVADRVRFILSRVGASGR